MRRVLALAFALIATPAAARKEPPVTADAVWRPATAVLEDVQKNCAAGGDCLIAKMKAGASPAAIAFSESIHNEGWLRDFRKSGNVDIAYVHYLNRADVWLLVNGTPSPVDVDDLRKLPKADMAENSAWQKLSGRNPNATLFPDDHAGSVGPLAIVHADGTQDFVVPYKVRDGCPTCAEIGTAFLAYEFNAKGKQTGLFFIDAVTESGAFPLPVRAGEKFTLVLGPGDWSLAQEPARWILRNTGHNGSSWTFQAFSNGSTQMVLTSGAETLTLRVTVAPGLGH